MTLDPDAHREDFERFYDAIGGEQLEEKYLVANWYALARYRLVLGLLAPVARRGGSMLDVGCASGYYSVAFASAGGVATGVDISQASVEIARRRSELAGVANRTEFLQGDMRDLRLRDSSFDAALMVEVIEHVREQREALAEVFRLLKPGGRLYLTTPNALDALPWWKRISRQDAPSPEAAGVGVQRLTGNEFVAGSGIAHEPYFHDAFTLGQLERLLPANARVVVSQSLNVMPPGVRLLPYVPGAIRRLGKRLLSQGAAPAQTAASPASTGPARDGDPVSIPPPPPQALVMTMWSRLIWRVPVIRRAGVHCLLVAERVS